jgi:hypothetical protein
MTAKEIIDEYISITNDWRGDLISEIRELIHYIEPEIVEEWKWNCAVFLHNGKMVCSTAAFKTHVKLNFFNGALIEDYNGLFNSGLDAKKSRSINFSEVDGFDKEALKELLTKAIEYNQE